MTPSAERNKLKIVQRLFNQLFGSRLNTRLEFGFDEPFYRAARASEGAIIQSRYDFLSSALHEVAHWCIAGADRRQVNDYGYWYEPDGRTEKQQTLFEQVEVKPQAMEWILSACCRHDFYFSADNLNGAIQLSNEFINAVTAQVATFWTNGLAERPAQLVKVLCGHFYPASQLPLTLEQIYNHLKSNSTPTNTLKAAEATFV